MDTLSLTHAHTPILALCGEIPVRRDPCTIHHRYVRLCVCVCVCVMCHVKGTLVNLVLPIPQT